MTDTLNKCPRDSDELDILNRWKSQTKLLIAGQVTKAVVRILGYSIGVFIMLQIILSKQFTECSVSWTRKTGTELNIQGTFNFRACDRGYDLFTKPPAPYSVPPVDFCEETVELTITEEDCMGTANIDLSVFEGPLAMFVDLNLQGIDYLKTLIGDPRDAAFPTGEASYYDECFVHGSYIYPCYSEVVSIYNDTIIITDANGVTIDASTDLEPLYALADSEKFDAGQNYMGSDPEVYEWLPEPIFPGRMENSRVKSWVYFNDRNVIDINMKDAGVEQLPIGLIRKNLKFPLTVNITDRWYVPHFPEQFTKTLKLTTPMSSMMSDVSLLVLVLLGLALLDLTYCVSQIVKLVSFKHLKSKKQLAQWIGGMKNPFIDIYRYSDSTSSVFNTSNTELTEAYRRTSVTSRARGTGMNFVRE